MFYNNSQQWQELSVYWYTSKVEGTSKFQEQKESFEIFESITEHIDIDCA